MSLDRTISTSPAAFAQRHNILWLLCLVERVISPLMSFYILHQVLIFGILESENMLCIMIHGFPLSILTAF